MNDMVHNAVKAAIALFVKKADSDKKIKAEAKINNIGEELYDLSLTGFLISAISNMEDTLVDS